VPYERGARDEADDADGKSQGGAHTWVGQFRKEPGKAGGREHRTEPIAAVPTPEDKSGRDKRPPRRQFCNSTERGSAGERRDGLAPRHSERQDPDRRGKERDADPPVPTEQHRVRNSD
jgi:hypothetical protein